MVNRLRRSPDFWAVLTLVLLWLLFFWRLFTPNEVDAMSLEKGDFSGQFVSWTSYSVQRFSDGEIPLWNPYMNVGAPFLADPQTAVFYPPRLVTVGFLAGQNEVTNGEIYAALQTEMTLHVLAGTLLMYAFLRRLTNTAEQRHSIIASIVGALIFGFGGFMSAYPQLQLPLLETAIWIPLVLLGIHEATRQEHGHLKWRWLLLASAGIGLSLMAGHPQTYMWTGIVSEAYLVYRVWRMKADWKIVLLAVTVLVMLGGGLAAIQGLPALEFQRHTYRQDFGFDDKGGGFVFQDIAQVLFPGLLSRWSPLYVGILGAVTVAVAIWRRVPDYWFWLVIGGIALLLSFGQKLIFYHLAYLVFPGFSFFRGQERAAYMVTTAAAILAASGTVHLMQWDILTDHKAARLLRRTLVGLIVFCAAFALVFFVLRLIPPNGELYQTALQSSIFATVMVVATLFVITQMMRSSSNRQWWQLAVVGVLVFDLFSVNINNTNYETIPASQRLPEPQYVEVIRANLDPGQRIEGLRGIRSSYGTLYQLPDIWGDSPLRLDGIEYLLWNIPIERRWELLAVQIVNSEWEGVSENILGSGEDEEGRFSIFRLDNPRPFAHMVHQVDYQSDARLLLNDVNFSLRDTIILQQDPGPVAAGQSQVILTKFEPEHIEITVETSTPGVLSLALPYTNGWDATVDEQEADILKAYIGLSAIYLEEGSHTIVLRYRPWTFRLGAFISIATLLCLLIGIVVLRPPQTEKEVNDDAKSPDHLEN